LQDNKDNNERSFPKKSRGCVDCAYAAQEAKTAGN